MKKWGPLAWILFLAVFVAAPRGVSRGALPVPYGGRLRVGTPQRVRPVLPSAAVGLNELVLARQLAETLIRIDEDGNVEPVMLLKAPETTDSITWELSLRPNIRDHKGYGLDATQVVASWERLLAPATGSMHWWLLAAVEGALDFRQGSATKVRGLTVVNPLKLRVKLAFPLDAFEEVIAAVPTAPSALPSLEAGKKAVQVGTGPFTYDEQESSAPAIRANTGHCQGRPFLDVVEWIDCSNDDGCRLGWKAGQIDVLIEPGWSPGIQAVTIAGTSWPVLLRVNPEAIPSRDMAKELVRFLDGALDRLSLARYAAGEHAVPMFHLLDYETSANGDAISTMPGAQVPFPMPALDLLFDSSDPLLARLADKLQLLLFDLGIPTTLVGLRPSVLVERIAAGDYGFAVVRPFVPVKNAVMRMAAMVAWSCPQARCAAMMGELIGRIASLDEPEQRIAVLRQLGRSYMHRLYVVPLLRHRVFMTARQRVRSMRLSLSGLPDLSSCWLRRGEEIR